jgi:homoserine O-acetyltransferase
MNTPPYPPEATCVTTESVTLFTPAHPFVLGSGASLAPVTVAFETYGSLNAARDNALLVCHALTGSAHAAGLSSADPRSAGWWDPMIGPGRPLDTSRYFVVCSNFLGSCYGTTGSASPDPRTGKPYRMTFPEYTVRDMVRLQKALMDHLGVVRLRTVTGGSLGGMQALEWPLMYPGMVASIIPIATATQHSPWCIGLNDLSRQAIMLDPAWKNGSYDPEAQPERGLSLARQIAMMSYRSDVSFQTRFRRERIVDGETVPLSDPQYAPQFQIERYLRYQGKKLVDRFDANTYLYITRAMDSHDVAAGRGALVDVLGSLHQPALCVGISSDVLYPAHEQRAIAASLPSSHYRELDAPHGHDAFLMSYDLLGPIVRQFLEECA